MKKYEIERTLRKLCDGSRAIGTEYEKGYADALALTLGLVKQVEVRIVRSVPECEISASGYCTRCECSPIAHWKFREHCSGEFVSGETEFNFCPACGARIVRD